MKTIIRSWIITIATVLLGILCYRLGGGNKHLVLSVLVVLTGIFSTYMSYKRGDIR